MHSTHLRLLQVQPAVDRDAEADERTHAELREDNDRPHFKGAHIIAGDSQPAPNFQQTSCTTGGAQQLPCRLCPTILPSNPPAGARSARLPVM